MKLFLILIASIFHSTLQIGDIRRSISCSNLYNGTTRNIEEIFKGRCFEFTNTIHKEDCDIVSKNYNCNNIWIEFSNIIIGRNPCDIQIDEFKNYLEDTDHFIAQNKSLFWSGTYTPAHESNSKFIYSTLILIFKNNLF